VQNNTDDKETDGRIVLDFKQEQLLDPDLLQFSHQRKRTARHSQRSVRGVSQNQSSIFDEEEEDLINPDEFEEIAEIYDTVRALHAKLDASKDQELAQAFDLKLRQVMESLAETVRDAGLGWAQKKAASLRAKQELLTVCSDKAIEFLKEVGAQGLASSPSKRSRI